MGQAGGGGGLAAPPPSMYSMNVDGDSQAGGNEGEGGGNANTWNGAGWTGIHNPGFEATNNINNNNQDQGNQYGQHPGGQAHRTSRPSLTTGSSISPQSATSHRTDEQSTAEPYWTDGLGGIARPAGLRSSPMDGMKQQHQQQQQQQQQNRTQAMGMDMNGMDLGRSVAMAMGMGMNMNMNGSVGPASRMGMMHMEGDGGDVQMVSSKVGF